jgi:hypothetical protein
MLILNLLFIGRSCFQEEATRRSQEVEGASTKGFWKGPIM